MLDSKSVRSNWNTVKARILEANNHYPDFGTATASMFRVMRELAPVERGMQKEIDYPTELELPEKSGYRKTKQKILLDYPNS